MTVAGDARLRPKADEDYRAPSRPARVGLFLAVIGLAITVAAFIGNLVAAGQAEIAGATLAWTFGVTTTGFAVIKVGIAVVLWGILMKLWLRASSIREALPRITGGTPVDPVLPGDVDTPYGRAVATVDEPPPLAIHGMAKRMWRPMLVMGAMAVLVGLVISLAEAGTGSNVGAAAWRQGLQFLGEGMLLSGIGFLLGTILWAIRTGGGEVQKALGVNVVTLRMPATAKVFVVLMMLGLVAEIVQFIGYLTVAANPSFAPAAFAWLGPLREAGLGLILTGITMALVTIGNVLGFQFHRVKQLIRAGRA